MFARLHYQEVSQSKTGSLSGRATRWFHSLFIVVFQSSSLLTCGMSQTHKDVILDIDGTVADCSHRQRFIRGKSKKWKKFFEAAQKDQPRIDVVAQVRELANLYRIH